MTANNMLLLGAVRTGDFERVKHLIHNGADINASDKDGNTALHWASTMGNTKIINLLISYFADINAQNKDGYTALHCVFQGGHIEVMKLLIHNGADLNAVCNDGYSVLHLAAIYPHTKNSVDIIKFLIHSGANVNATNKEGNTPLHLTSVRYSGPEIVELLINARTDLKIANIKGETNIEKPQKLTDYQESVKFTEEMDRILEERQ